MELPESPDANPENLLGIIQEASFAKVVVPEFQRSFVWSRDDIEELLVSILSRYFIGTILTLDTATQEPLFPFRAVEGLDKVNPSVRPDRHGTVRLILDGQQRITSLFYALYSPDIPLNWARYPHQFFLRLEPALNDRMDDAVVGISLRDRRRLSEILQLVQNEMAVPFTLLRDSAAFNRWLFRDQQRWRGAQEAGIERVQKRLYNFMVPVVSLPQHTSKDDIVNIFERINRTGISLSLFDLSVARLYPKGVRLRDLWKAFEKTHDTARAVKPDALLRIISLFRGKEPRKGNLLDVVDAISKQDFEALWQRAIDAAADAHQRMTRHYGSVDENWIPYGTMIVPLAACLDFLKERRAGEQAYRYLDAWYWSSVFGQRFDQGVDTKTQQDYSAFQQWVTDGKEIDWVNKFPQQHVDLEVDEPRSAIYRGIICLIVQKGALDFMTGQAANLHECQDDHIFSKAGFGKSRPVDLISNRSLISKETNNWKRDKKPSIFIRDCLVRHGNTETRLLRTLASHFINEEGYRALLSDDFDRFRTAREQELRAAIALATTGYGIVGNGTPRVAS